MSRRIVLISNAGAGVEHLVEPIIRRCRKSNALEAHVFEPDPMWDFDQIIKKTKERLTRVKPDIVLVPCDRREQVPVAMASFYSNIPTFHFLGGAKGSGTWDDVARHVMSCFSHIIFVESPEAKQRLVDAGEEAWRCVVTGTTHFDDIDLKSIKKGPSPVKGNYDLMLMNPVTLSPETTRRDTRKALSLIDKYTIILPPNEDRFRDIVIRKCKQYKAKHQDMVKIVERRLDRTKFLRLLAHCDRYISNSSAVVYEAPMFDCKVINPSQRNWERGKIDIRWLKGGADRVVRFMSGVELDNGLLMKRLRCYI